MSPVDKVVYGKKSLAPGSNTLTYHKSNNHSNKINNYDNHNHNKNHNHNSQNHDNHNNNNIISNNHNHNTDNSNLNHNNNTEAKISSAPLAIQI